MHPPCATCRMHDPKVPRALSDKNGLMRRWGIPSATSTVRLRSEVRDSPTLLPAPVLPITRARGSHTLSTQP